MNPEVFIRIKMGNTPILEFTLEEAKSLYDELRKVFGEKYNINPHSPYPVYTQQSQEPYYGPVAKSESICSA